MGVRRRRWRLPALAGAFALAVAALAIRAPDRSVAELSTRWAPSPSVFRPVDGLQAHYRDEGLAADSVPVLLLHGTSASLHTWEGWSAALRGSRRVISVDLPGFGLTGPDSASDYRMTRYTRFVVALLDSLRIERADIAGNSLGGEIAWEVAAAYPTRVRKLVLVDPAGFPLASTSVPIGFRMARTPSLSWIFTRILPRNVVESSVKNVYGDPSRVTPDLVTRYYELTLREGNRAALPARFAQMAPGADTARLAAITAPTLLLWGGRDQLIPPSTAARFQRLLPNAQLVIYPELGHVPHEEDAARTVADVMAFLNGG
jgi:pimeloyl-ACP methyl ester carboxylesterase